MVVISYGLWRSHFGGDISVIGKSVQINLHPYTVIGVAPPRFEGCMHGLRGDVWIPLMMAPTVWNWGPIENRGQFWLNALGRLKHGVKQQQARAELDLLMQRILDRFPDDHRGPNQISLDPLWRSPFGPTYIYPNRCPFYWPSLGRCCCWRAPMSQIFSWFVPSRAAARSQSACP